MKKTLLLLLALLPFSHIALSQVKAGHHVSGTIADSTTRKALDYITVSLKSEKNVVIKSIVTKSDGTFSFSGIAPSKYSLAVVAVGFKPQNLKIDLRDSALKLQDLGTIYLVKASKNLKEVVVTADKPIVTQEIDRISYNLQADPESKVSSVLEMMRKVPLLSLDGEDNILLKGNENYKILINGRPSGMVERNPKDILRSMPASTIEKIEVITTPPAKYDADGLAGIINIITHKKVDNGYNASINFKQSFPVGGPNLAGSFTAKQGKFGVSGNGGGNLFNSPATTNLGIRSTDGNQRTNLNQAGSRESDSGSGYFGAELSYELDSLNLISGQFNINGNQNNALGNQQSLLTGNTGVIQNYRLDNDSEDKGNGIDAAINYQLGFKADKNRLLTFSYRFLNFGNDQFANLTNNNLVNNARSAYTQNNHGEALEHTFQLDYVHPVKKLTIEAGVKGILRTNKSDFRFDSLNTTGQFVIDPLRSNRFNNQQDVYAVYNSYQYNLKSWGFKAGLRLEQTVIDADFSGSDLRRDYLNLAPSFSVNRKLKNMSSLTFGYSYRIRRPGIFHLNPFVDRSNPNFESSGNPNLRPMSGNSLELKYSRFKKGSFNFGLSYEFYDKLIMPVSTFDAATNITRTMPGNSGQARLLGSQANINYPLTKKMNLSVNWWGGYGRVKGLVNDKQVENDGFMYHFSASTGYKFEKNWRLNGTVNLSGPNLTLQGGSNRFNTASFSLHKDIIKDKLTVSALANNPFAKYRYNIRRVSGPNFSQETENQSYLRNYSASLNYKFGKLKSGLKKNRKGIVNDDISSGSGTP